MKEWHVEHPPINSFFQGMIWLMNETKVLILAITERMSIQKNVYSRYLFRFRVE